MNSIRQVWDSLDEDTRAWLMAHNGEPVDDEIRSSMPDGWVGADGALPDHLVDWIEAVANGEAPD